MFIVPMEKGLLHKYCTGHMHGTYAAKLNYIIIMKRIRKGNIVAFTTK